MEMEIEEAAPPIQTSTVEEQWTVVPTMEPAVCAKYLFDFEDPHIPIPEKVPPSSRNKLTPHKRKRNHQQQQQ